MLAAATTTTGDWIIGGIAVVVVLGVIVGAIWLLVRLLTWPARARRRRSSGGLGSDYEQMIRQQRRNPSPTGERPLPYPPPGGWRPAPTATAPATSQVVLPPPPYRTWEPDASEPTAPSPEPESAPASASTWERVMRTPRITPAWLILPLAWLGIWFIVSKPLVGSSWNAYGSGLVVAVLGGIWTKRNHRSKILWRAPRNVLAWQRWGRLDDSQPLPVEVQAAAEAVAATQEPGAAGEEEQRATS